MSKYYILNLDAKENSYYAENGKINDEEIITLSKRGVSLEKEKIEINLFKNKGEVLHHIGNVFFLPIISETIIDVIKEVSTQKEVEYFPVKVNMDTKCNYYFINILKNEDAIDFEKSDCSTFSPKTKVVRKINKLVLLDSVLEQRNIFRLKGFKSEIFISEKLKQNLEKLDIKEISFTPLEKFTWELGSFEW